MAKHELVAADILPTAEYATHRAEHRRRVSAHEAQPPRSRSGRT